MREKQPAPMVNIGLSSMPLFRTTFDISTASLPLELQTVELLSLLKVVNRFAATNSTVARRR